MQLLQKGAEIIAALCLGLCFVANLPAQVYDGQTSSPVLGGDSVTQFTLGDDSPSSNFRPSNGSSQAGTWSAFVGLDGSKQPQDYGVNANFGGRGSLNYSAPLLAEYGIGFQAGSAIVATANAVQVFELLGAATDRFQSYTTVGVFQRTPNGFAAGAVYDFLYQDSFDQFQLGQWRLRGSFDISPELEIGTTVNLNSRSDVGRFNSTLIELQPIEMLNVYVNRRWLSGVTTMLWAGVADGHSENNAITGALPRKENQFLFGAEFFAPLNNFMAIYGETNIMMPVDTGSVDAYLGIELIPGGLVRKGRQNRYRALLPVASGPTFTNDLIVR